MWSRSGCGNNLFYCVLPVRMQEQSSFIAGKNRKQSNQQSIPGIEKIRFSRACREADPEKRGIIWNSEVLP